MRWWLLLVSLAGGCSVGGGASDRAPSSAPWVDEGCGSCSGGGGGDAVAPDAGPEASAAEAGASLFALPASGGLVGLLAEGCYGCIRERCPGEMLTCDLSVACRAQGECAIERCFFASNYDEILLGINCACPPLLSCTEYAVEPALRSLLDCARGACWQECWQ